MRVYGASPLYNYVELVFRSKRLFIVSIVLATLIVSALATMRSGQYTAMAMILLTGKEQSAYQSNDESQLGTVKYKLNMLSIFLKDPEFMKKAIKNAIAEQTGRAEKHVWPDTQQTVDYNFDTNMSDLAFDKFCKDARQALSFAQGEGILELSCRWPDKKAADILNAFYWEFHDQVVSHEIINSSDSEALLKKLLDDYTQREKNIEQKIVAYKRDHIVDPPENPDAASNALVQDLNGLEEMKLSLRMAQERRDAYAQQLKNIKAQIISEEVTGGFQDNSVYKMAVQKKEAAQQALELLRTKYQDSHPKVREAQAAVDEAEAERLKAEKLSQKSQNLQSRKTIQNPDYVRTVAIINQADAELKGLRASYDLRAKMTEVEKQRALKAGQKNYDFKWLTDEYGIVGTIRTNLENRLQAAELAKKQEAQRSSAETAMVVKPMAEQESGGSRGFLLYAAGPILGIIIAFAFSLVAETLDHSLRTPIEVEKHLGKPVLAVLPRMDPPRPSRRQLAGGSERGQATLPPVS